MRKLLKIPYRIIDRTVQYLIPEYKKYRKYEQESHYWNVVYNKKVINNVMIYKMNSDDYSEPSNHYYNCAINHF